MTQEDLDKWAERDPWGRFVKEVLAGREPSSITPGELLYSHLNCVGEEKCKASVETRQ